MTAMGQDRQNS